jgi:hypothetical protein
MQHAHGPHPQTFLSPGGVELNGYLPCWCGSRVHELASGLRLDTAMPSQDLSGAWVNVSR